MVEERDQVDHGDPQGTMMLELEILTTTGLVEVVLMNKKYQKASLAWLLCRHKTFLADYYT